MLDKKLATQILKCVKADQTMRRLFAKGKQEWDWSVDKSNSIFLKKTIALHGWPTISMVGKKASDGAFLLAQHADHDLRFQKKSLKLMSEIHKTSPKEITLHNIAFLTDRILVHEHKRQIFGTQFRKDESGLYKPYPVKDPKKVNKRRKAYGMRAFEQDEKMINFSRKRK